jgi:hypothetical protein
MVGDMESDAEFAAALGAKYYSAEEFFGRSSPAQSATEAKLV